MSGMFLLPLYVLACLLNQRVYTKEGSRRKHCSQVDLRENWQEDVASSILGQHAKLLQTRSQF
ncbi:unnamed protein product [Tetraodon nigroviridis]|uniref:(spotted green pufferfish) hypothetical protein n=1 Tax=Tetraodon nigroviridis TaxID=99883 RepID=Q4RRJ1_TETNG|nr:unnamed protein product [Tetraodon nigroviridis]